MKRGGGGRWHGGIQFWKGWGRAGQAPAGWDGGTIPGPSLLGSGSAVEVREVHSARKDPRKQAAVAPAWLPCVQLQRQYTAGFQGHQRSSAPRAAAQAVFLLIGKTSALTMNIAGVIKDWMLIFFSFSLFHAPVTALNLGGYAFCCTGARLALLPEGCYSVLGETGARHIGITVTGPAGHEHCMCCMALCKALEVDFSVWAPYLKQVPIF